MSDVDLNDLRRAALPFLLLVAIGLYAGTRPHVPAASTVNGVYTNPCCGEVRLVDGVMYTASRKIPFRVVDMKFGRALDMSESVQVDNGRTIAIGRTDPNLVPYDVAAPSFELGGVFHTPTAMQIFQFKRAVHAKANVRKPPIPGIR